MAPARHDHGRRQPLDGDGGDHRSVAAEPGLALHESDVRAAHPDGRGHPAHRQDPRAGRLAARQDGQHRDARRRPVRPGDGNVDAGGNDEHAAALSLGGAAPARRHRVVRRRQSGLGELGKPDGDLPAGVPVQRRRRSGDPAHDQRRPLRDRLRRQLPGEHTERRQHRLGRAHPQRRQHPRLRHGPADDLAVLHEGRGHADDHGAAERQHRAARPLHAVHRRRQRRDADGAVSAYRWIFPGGSPATSTSATPGNVTFSTPGTYYVSLTVTDNQGGTDPSPPVRVITVQSATLTASFTNPAEGATVDGTVSVGMSASGAGGGSATFTLTVDGQPAFSNTTTGTTQSYSWDTRSVADGVHTLGLIVRDATGATASAARTVSVNNSAPGTLQVTFPNVVPGQTVRGTLAVQIAVSGANGTNNRFTVFVDGVQQTVIASNTTSVTWNWDTTTASNGSRTISASVQDATGNTGSGFTYVQVQNPTFQAFITQPTNGATVSGAAVWTTMWVEGAAAGSKTYTLSVGGRNLASTSDTSNGPVTLAWDSRQVTNGIQTLKAMVTDSAGALGSTTVQVNVQNSGPGPLSAGFSSPASGATVSGTVSVGMVAGGGTAPYTYTLTIDGAQVVSSPCATTPAPPRRPRVPSPCRMAGRRH
ncbi:MAG: hypothetical protein DMD85_18160 [Candidatus Rokuibacteriota bacterium]|nr:MAG: hypothetical protein DMD85_18160 [Candidatus Rokubacteria bacterium]